MIVEENETAKGAFAHMPYLKSLANRYGTATRYTGLVHPSLGNYLAMVSGTGVATCGLRDPVPSHCPQSGTTVFGRALSAGKSATTYAESMVVPCQTTNRTSYAPRHNPWTYFPAERSRCAAHDLPLGTTTSGPLRADITAATLPNAGMVVPNLLDDAHDGTLGQADAWLRRWMPEIMAGPDYLSGRLAIVVTFDEGSGTDQNVPFVVVQRSLWGRVVTSHYTHDGLCRMYTDVLGLAPLHAAATEPGLLDAFRR
ncbi:MAG: alkaline phosphatase family protein [Lapillicoccus sp.]